MSSLVQVSEKVPERIGDRAKVYSPLVLARSANNIQSKRGTFRVNESILSTKRVFRAD